MIWEDQMNGEIHWHKTEYEGLLKTINDLKQEIEILKQTINSIVKSINHE
jgi:archaellum component FlaC